MSELTKWKKLLECLPHSAPLNYTHGMRHDIGEDYCPFHNHHALEIVYHPIGSGVTRMKNKQEIHFEEGSIVIYAPEEWHDQSMTTHGEDLCVHVMLPKKLPLRLRGGLHISRIKNSLVIQEIESLARGYSKLSKTEQTIFNLRATAVLISLIQEACNSKQQEENSSSEMHVEETERYIRENFQSIGLLQQVADHVGISHDRLRHVFKEVRSKSLIRYVNEVRIDRAKSLLIHSPFPLKQIATMCGYKDEYYFSAVFRRFTRTSAGAYRKRNKSIPR